MARPQLTTEEVESTRRRLTDAALGLYRADGIEAVSFRGLAERLGVSHTLPYRYFDSKDALLAQLRCELVQGFEAFMRGRADRDASPRDRLHAMFGAYVEYARRYPAEYQLIFATHQPPPDRFPELLAARRRMFDFALEVVQRCIDAGEIAGDPREVAHAFWVGLHGLMSLHVANQLVHGLDLSHLAPSLFTCLLNSLQPRSGSSASRLAVSAAVPPKSVRKPRRSQPR